jgi:uncharacterized protein YjaZ
LEAWQDMQSQLNTKNYVIQKRYALGDGGRIPLSTAYTIGIHIAQSFLTHHPEISIDEWTSLDPQDLLIQSRYQGVQ